MRADSESRQIPKFVALMIVIKIHFHGLIRAENEQIVSFPVKRDVL